MKKQHYYIIVGVFVLTGLLYYFLVHKKKSNQEKVSTLLGDPVLSPVTSRTIPESLLKSSPVPTSVTISPFPTGRTTSGRGVVELSSGKMVSLAPATITIDKFKPVTGITF